MVVVKIKVAKWYNPQKMTLKNQMTFINSFLIVFKIQPRRDVIFWRYHLCVAPTANLFLILASSKWFLKQTVESNWLMRESVIQF
jgi:hypothetical protein